MRVATQHAMRGHAATYTETSSGALSSGLPGAVSAKLLVLRFRKLQHCCLLCLHGTRFSYVIGATLVSTGSSAGAAYCIVHRLSCTHTTISCWLAVMAGAASSVQRTVSTLLRLFGGKIMRMKYPGPWSPKISPPTAFDGLPRTPVAAAGNWRPLTDFFPHQSRKSQVVRGARLADH